MKNIYSNIFSFNKKTLSKTIINLKKGNVLGLPTETVYGLAGNAYSIKAIKKIYKLKNRPKQNPLIVHFYSIDDVKRDVFLNKNFFKLYKKFCPGPITFILKKKTNSRIKFMCRNKFNTIAVRFPKHKIIRSVLKNIHFPLAMPSANVSSHLSPICAEDVSEEFKKKLKIIINGGRSKIGIESTVIDLTGIPRILRPGIIGPETIRNLLKIKMSFKSRNSQIKSPGMLKKHYSPGIPVYLNKSYASDKVALITYGKKYKNKKNQFNLSKNSNLKKAASNLFKTLRKIKKLKYKKINVVKIPYTGPGIAINDRLKRAAKK